MTDFVPLPISPDLDRGYNARASVASFDVEYAKYVAASARVKAECSFTTHVYDQVSGEKLDLYPAEHGAPLFLWIHGGYWRASSKDDNAFVVPGLLNHGVSVAVLDYTLAPAVTLDEIVRQVRTAFAFLHSSATDLRYDSRRIHIGGSSAGGHLTGMLLAGGWRQAFGVPEESIGIAMPLSGLFELDPLRSTHINQWMRLDEAAAKRNSPIQLILQARRRSCSPPSAAWRPPISGNRRSITLPLGMRPATPAKSSRCQATTISTSRSAWAKPMACWRAPW